MHPVICKFSSPASNVHIMMPEQLHTIPKKGDYVYNINMDKAFEVTAVVHGDTSVCEGTILVLSYFDVLPVSI